MDGLSIGLATRDDVPAIVALLADDFLGRTRDRVDGGLLAYYQAFDRIAEDPNNKVYVACRDDAVVGCFQLTYIPGLSFGGGTRAQIESVRTRADLRGQGIGGAMMRFAIEQARMCGCAIVQLSTNKQRADAHRFYERLGFVHSHHGMKLAFGPAGR